MPEEDTASPGPYFKRHFAKVAMIGVAVAVVAGIGTFAALSGTAEPRTVDVTQAAPAQVKIDPDHPFAATPAESWADGEAGIAAPAAAAIGSFTKQQVNDGYAKVRQAVITSRLDRTVLEKHDVEQYLKLLARDSQKKMRPVFTDNPHDSHAYATRLKAGYPLLPAAPKVSGKMWAEQGDKQGELVVHTNFVFAYAFTSDKAENLTDVMDTVVVDRWDTDYSVLITGYTPSSLGVWPKSSKGFTYSMGCDALSEGYLAPAFSERRANAATETTTRDRTKYFDPGSTLPANSTCDR